MSNPARPTIYRILRSAGVRDPGTIADAILGVLDQEGCEVRPPRHLRPVK